MEYCTVVTIRDGVVNDVYLFSGDIVNVDICATKKFLEIITANKGPVNDEELLQVWVDDGYCELADNCFVCISWPTTIEV
jgi:hypothetical protein